MCCIKIGSIVDNVDIEERYLKIKKYIFKCLAAHAWQIKIGSNILPERYEDKHSIQEREMRKRQQYSTMPYQGSTRLEAKPCA